MAFDYPPGERLRSPSQRMVGRNGKDLLKTAKPGKAKFADRRWVVQRTDDNIGPPLS